MIYPTSERDNSEHTIRHEDKAARGPLRAATGSAISSLGIVGHVLHEGASRLLDGAAQRYTEFIDRMLLSIDMPYGSPLSPDVLYPTEAQHPKAEG